jgi:hypothetical protein
MDSLLFSLACFIPVIFIIFVSGILIGYVIKNSNLINQNRGEASVHNLIVSNFRAPMFHLLNNVTLPFQDGTTQLDHVLVSTKGIFVIETKHYSGWIFANENSQHWTQIIYRLKNRFQNPVHQNYRHLKAIQQLLDFLPKEQLHSVVVFSGNAVFKSPLPNGVVYLRQLKDYLCTFQDDVISTNRMEFCVGHLECKRFELTRETDVQHRAYLARKYGR